ncbi:Dynamin GTPase effector - like 1 [Theobroma cacao]|nr:Dynamin GTPase effector - like 1 [Theobroma cacao]
MREQSMNRVKEIVQMEKLTDYTCNPVYMVEWTKLMAQQENFVRNVNAALNKTNGPYRVSLEGFGDIEVEHLRQHRNVVHSAFDLKVRMIAYWKIVLQRLVDSMALHLQYSVHNLVNNDMEEIVNELMGPDGRGIERMLVEAPAIAGKREKLKKSIKLLKESKDVVAKIMDRIAGKEII